jgi:hypothetical protein
MKTRIKQWVLGLVAVGTLAGFGSQAIAGTAYQPITGAPYNSGDKSAFSFIDGMACFNSGRIWLVPIPIPTSSGVVTHHFNADYGNMGSIQAWSFTNNGAAYSGVNFSSFNATIDVPANGTAFGKFIATSSPTLQACVRNVVFVN